LYAPHTQNPSFGSVYIHGREAQYAAKNLVKYLTRVYTAMNNGYDGNLQLGNEERSYHGLIGLNLGQGLTQLWESTLDPEPDDGFTLFPITADVEQEREPGRALIGFFYEAVDNSVSGLPQVWKCVVRNIAGTTIVDTGVTITTGQEAGEWFKMRIERDPLTGDLHFFIQKNLEAEVEKIILASDTNIPLLDMDGETMFMGKIHYITPVTQANEEVSQNLQYLEYIDYDTSKFVDSTDTPVFPPLYEI
jgi:hypothetical protein